LLTLVNQILDFSKLEAGKRQSENITFILSCKLFVRFMKHSGCRRMTENLISHFMLIQKIPVALNGDVTSLNNKY
jgi:signal transduction histidine kinase